MMVVLSKQHVHIAGGLARGRVAITLSGHRSIPAMPMAESSPPMVVYEQTSRATSTVP
jgi:hypothetical protein